MLTLDKRLLVISHGPLAINATAGEAVMCGFAQAGLARGWNVTFAAVQQGPFDLGKLIRPPFFFTSDGKFRNFDCEVPSPAVARGLRELYRSSTLLPKMPAVALSCLEESFTALVAFDTVPYVLGRRVDARRKFLILGDPAGERLLHSALRGCNGSPRSMRRLVAAALVRATERRKWRVELNRGNWMVGMFGTHHARSWAKSLHRRVADLRPMLLPISSSKPKSAAPFVIAFGGSLTGTASKFALPFLEKHLLPKIAADVGRTIVFRVVGECGEPFYSLLRNKPGVEICGRVPDFAQELANADVFILPSAYPIGVRTRICAALQAGCTCICFPDVLKGMPELAECSAVAIVQNPREMLEAIDRLRIDRKDKRGAARDFFARHYAANAAANAIYEHLETTNEFAEPVNISK